MIPQLSQQSMINGLNYQTPQQYQNQISSIPNKNGIYNNNLEKMFSKSSHQNSKKLYYKTSSDILPNKYEGHMINKNLSMSEMNYTPKYMNDNSNNNDFNSRPRTGLKNLQNQKVQDESIRKKNRPSSVKIINDISDISCSGTKLSNNINNFAYANLKDTNSVLLLQNNYGKLGGGGSLKKILD